jgi:hypothetical protein
VRTKREANAITKVVSTEVLAAGKSSPEMLRGRSRLTTE